MNEYEETMTEETESIVERNFPKEYIRFRTVLDALEVNALRYCLSGTSAAERKRRAAEIEALLMPIIEKVNGRPKKSSDVTLPGVCDDGYHNCGGICVPYQCPENSLE